MLQNTSILPSYSSISPEENSTYIRQMLPLMLKHNVPVDPMNYAIWYHYVAGVNDELNKTIDTLISTQQPFDGDITLNLYKKFICNASFDSFEKINTNLQQLISQVSTSLNSAGEKASAASDDFNEKLKELETAEDEDAENLKSILVSIILETTKLSEASKELKNQLNTTNIEIEQLRDELTHVRKASSTDGLTGLLNRLAFDKALDELVLNSIPKKACLAILDIDNFKRINDSFGHVTGDKVIKFVASILNKHTEEQHQVARYGGEEMAVIMPETALPEAYKLIEQIRRDLESARIKHKTNKDTIGQVTVSAGIASLQVGDDSNSLLSRADNALYRAKESGRNKVITESPRSIPCRN
jgi:diguanylate cyclase